MNFNGKSFKLNILKKFAAVFMALLMILSAVPANVITSFAMMELDKVCIASVIDNKKIYFYGADLVFSFDEDKGEIDHEAVIIDFSNKDIDDIVSFYVNGKKVTSGSLPTVEDGIVQFGNWLSSQSGWVAVQVGTSCAVPSSEPKNVNSDTTAPGIPTVKFNPEGWSNSSVEVIPIAQDNAGGSGVVAYLWDFDEESEYPYLSVTSDNFVSYENDADDAPKHTLRVVDRNGNISPAYEFEIKNKIDTEPPVKSSIYVESNPGIGWSNNIILTVHATDNLSGVAEYKMDGDPEESTGWQKSPNFKLKDEKPHTFYVKDYAGNYTSYDNDTSSYLFYDDVAPEIDDVEVKTENGDEIAEGDYTNNGNYVFSITAHDIENSEGRCSGVEYYSADGFNWQASNQFNLPGASDYTFYVKDGAGNISQVKTLSLKEDTDKPTVSSIESLNGTDYTNKPVTVKVNAVDETSGVASYKMDDDEWQDSNEFEISDCNEHTFYVSDNCKPANIAEAKFTADFYCDKLPVISSVTLSNFDESGVQKWTNESIKATVNAESVINSASNEIKIVGYKMDGDPTEDDGWVKSNEFTVNDCKSHKFYVKDEAGCVSEAYEISDFKFDNIVPELKNVEFKQVNSNVVAKALNKLTFGKFFNEKLKITATLSDTSSDDSAVSGIDESQLKMVFKSDDNEISFTSGQLDISEKDGDTTVVLELANKEVLNNFYGSLYFSVADYAGNVNKNIQVTSANSNLFDVEDTDFNFVLENDAPVITSNGTDDLSDRTAVDGNTLFNDSFDINFNVNDKTDKENSGLSFVTVKVNGTEVLNKDYSSLNEKTDSDEIKYTFDKSAVQISDDCKLNFEITACDNSGNVSIKEFTLYYDDIAPEFECQSDMEGWTNTKATVTVNATDNYALNDKAYKLDDGEYDSNNVFDISDSNEHIFYVKDKAGNVTTKTFKLKLDSVPPTIKGINLSTNEPTNQPITATVDAEDVAENPEKGEEAVSGIAAYKMDGNPAEEKDWQEKPEFTISDDKEHTFYVKDNAGNIASAKKTASNYDNEKPQNLAVVVEDPEGKILDSSSFLNTDEAYTFEFSADDNKGAIKQYGIKSSETAEIEWLGTDESGNAVSTVSKKTTEIYSIYAMDAAGNVSDELKLALNIDTTAPTFKISYSKHLTNKPVTITVNDAKDVESGLYEDKNGDTTAYKMDDGDWQMQNTFIVADNDEHTIYVRNGAHIVASQKFTVRNYIYIEFLKAPEVVETVTEWSNEKTAVKVTGTAHKNILGESAQIVKYRVDGGEWVDTDTFELKDCKQHKYQVMDEAGNISKETVFSAKMYDAQSPVLDTVTFEQKNTNSFAKLLNKLTFGNFFNKHLQITVVAKDPTDPVTRGDDGVVSEASLIKDISFTFDNGNEEEKLAFDNDVATENEKVKDVKLDKENGITTFTIDVSDSVKLDNFKGMAYLTLRDNAGNENADIKITCGNSNVDDIKDTDYNFTIENDAPAFYSMNGEELAQDNAVDSINGAVRNGYSLKFNASDVFTDEAGNEKEYSGLASVKVDVNGKEVLKQDLNDTERIASKEFEIPVVGFVNDGTGKPADSSYTVNGISMFGSEDSEDDYWNDGKLNFVLTAVDNSGNESEPVSLTYTFDQTAPVITKFEIADKESTNKDYVLTDNYGFFFREDTTVKIYAQDKVNTDIHEAFASGVASITVLKVDINGGVEQLVYTGDDSESENKLTYEGEEAVAAVQVNKGFKGQIYAFATDLLGNKPSNAEYFADKDISVTFGEESYVHPDGTIIEDLPEHIENSSIEITQSNKPVAVQNNYYDYKDDKLTADKEISYNSSSKVPLYNQTATFVSKISDTKAGIASVKYTIIENGKESSKTVNVKTVSTSSQPSKDTVVTPTLSKSDSDFTVKTGNTDQSGIAGEEWKVQSEISATDLNLATEINSVITIDVNYNDVVLKVELTDNAGNKSYDYTVFGIDRTAPEIFVQYESEAKPISANYYNKTRYAYISIRERNITSADVQLLIEKCLNNSRNFNSSDKSDYYKGFDIENNLFADGSGNHDNREYRIRVSFADDGNYLIKTLSCVDTAKNASGEVTYSKVQSATNNDVVTKDNNTMFTIDKIKPDIKVSLDINDQVKNRKYFNKTRTATITVNEHNFNTSDAQAFVNNITASLNGRNITKPSVSSFRQSSSDVWTATVTFSADGDYTLGFKATDMAGNEYEITKATTGAFSGAAASDFTIDKTAPTISITDALSNNHAYVNVPTIVITEKDNNASTITSSVDGTYFNKDSALLKQTSIPAQNSGELIAEHRLENQVTYTAVENDGVYTIKASCVDMAGNKSDEKTLTFTKNENGSVFIPSADLIALNENGYSNSDNLSTSLYVDEYSSVAVDDVDYYMNINGKRQDNGKMLTREQIRDEDSNKGGWYHYRYLIDKNEIHAEGKYSLYIRSSVNVDNKVIQNNDENNSDINRVNVNFVIDNTNPYVKIQGLDRHTYINTAKVPVTFYVSDTNLSYIKVWIYNGNEKIDEDTIPTYTWNAQEDSENGILAWSEEDGLAKVSFDLFANATSTNVKFEIVDKAGNKCSKESDFNQDQLFINGAEESQRLGFFDIKDGFITLKSISINEKISVSAIASIIKDNIKLAVVIIVAIIILIAAAIILPIIAKRRKKLDNEDSKLLD